MASRGRKINPDGKDYLAVITKAMKKKSNQVFSKSDLVDMSDSNLPVEKRDYYITRAFKSGKIVDGCARIGRDTYQYTGEKAEATQNIPVKKAKAPVKKAQPKPKDDYDIVLDLVDRLGLDLFQVMGAAKERGRL